MIIDNKKNGNVGDVLKQSIKSNSKLSIISGHFTIYAFAELKKELSKIKELRLLFTSPMFKKNHISNYLSGEHEERKYKNQLQQVKIARECATWVKDKVKTQEVNTNGVIPFNLYHIDNNGNDTAIQGSSNFSSIGLGYTSSNTFAMNTLVKDKESTRDFLDTFDEIWNDKKMVSDVKDEIKH